MCRCAVAAALALPPAPPATALALLLDVRAILHGRLPAAIVDLLVQYNDAASHATRLGGLGGHCASQGLTVLVRTLYLLVTNTANVQ